MKLMSIEHYQRCRFVEGSAPDVRTLRNWIENGDMPGVKRGRRYFVDITNETQALGVDVGTAVQLMGLPQYIEARFVVGSRPDIRTVRNWLDKDELPGIRYGKLYFINVSSECWTTGNVLMDKVLAA